jgi:predicted AAA+ superfamily ATPase
MNAEAERKITQILITRQDLWWNKVLPEIPPFRRRDFNYLLESLYKPRATVLIGPRQIGKTTIVMQIIRELLVEGKVDPKRILYVLLDDVELQLLSKNVMLDVIEVYKKNILSEDINLTPKDTFLFFDEVQRVDNWADVVKTFHTANKNLHIFATGSAGFAISQKGKETLPGRAEIYTMYPLKFIDTVLLYYTINKDKKKFDFASTLNIYAYQMRQGLIEALKSKSFDNFFIQCQKIYTEMLGFEVDLQAGIRRYLSKGGYPEIIIENDVSECQRLLRSYANDIIVKDLMPWFNIRDFPTAEKLMFLMASMSGEQLNKQELLKRIGGSNSITLGKYIDYLENVFIVGQLPSYSGSKLGPTKHPKIYYHDTGLRNAVLGVLDSPLLELEKGHLAETAIYDHVLRLGYKLNESTSGKTSFYRNQRGEIDFILNLDRYGIKLLVESKFRKNIEDHKTTREFMSEHKNTMGIIITEALLDYRDNLLLMPLWMFLSLC